MFPVASASDAATATNNPSRVATSKEVSISQVCFLLSAALRVRCSLLHVLRRRRHVAFFLSHLLNLFVYLLRPLLSLLVLRNLLVGVLNRALRAGRVQRRVLPVLVAHITQLFRAYRAGA